MQTQAMRGGFVAGVRLVPESMRHMARMRNVWLVVLLFAVLSSHWRMGFRLQGDRPDGSLGKMIAVVVQTQYHWVWTHPGYPEYAVVQVLRGVQRPLNTRFVIVQNAVAAVSGRIFGPQSLHSPPRGLRLSFEILLANLLYAALSAGILGWIKLSIEGQPLNISALFRCVARVTGPIYCWFLLLDAVKLLVTGLAPLMAHSRVSEAAVQAVALALLLPFAFIPFVVVAWEKSIVTAFPASLRVFASRLVMVLGFLIVFRIAAEALFVFSTALRDYGAWVVSSHVGRFALLLASDLAAAAIALLLCTAFMLIVLRTEEKPVEAELAVQGAQG